MAAARCVIFFLGVSSWNPDNFFVSRRRFWGILLFWRATSLNPVCGGLSGLLFFTYVLLATVLRSRGPVARSMLCGPDREGGPLGRKLGVFGFGGFLRWRNSIHVRHSDFYVKASTILLGLELVAFCYPMVAFSLTCLYKDFHTTLYQFGRLNFMIKRSERLFRVDIISCIHSFTPEEKKTQLTRSFN